LLLGDLLRGFGPGTVDYVPDLKGDTDRGLRGDSGNGDFGTGGSGAVLRPVPDQIPGDNQGGDQRQSND